MEAENDRLRHEVATLNDRVKALEGERDELAAKVSPATPAEREALDATPRLAGIEVGSLSGYVPVDSAKPATGVVGYIVTKDGRDRFVQAVGSLKVEAMVEGRVVAIAELTPRQVRDAYRSGFTGTHYEVQMPLLEPVARGTATMLVKAEFRDSATGRVYSAEHEVRGPKP